MAQTLLGKGFTRVKVIKGGMQAWEAAGYPMKMGSPPASGASGNTIQVNPSGGQSQVVPINPGQGNESIVVTVPSSGGAPPAATP